MIAFYLFNQLNPSLVGSTLTFGMIGVRKYVRNCATLLIVPISTLVWIEGRSVPWDNSSNLLKDI